MDREEKDFLLEKVMIQYGDELVRLAFSYVKDAETAKDLIQNTFIKCYSSLDSFRHEAHIKTWLYRLAINECKDYLKSWNYRMIQVSSLISGTAKSIAPSAEKAVIDKQTDTEIKGVLLALPKAYREVVYLYYYDSLKPGEIADILDIPLNTVKTRLRRGKEKLKSTMEEAELNGR